MNFHLFDHIKRLLSGRAILERVMPPPAALPPVELPQIESARMPVDGDGRYRERAELERRQREHETRLARLRVIARVRSGQHDS